MNVNIIGFGSIGKRHLKHLLRFEFVREIKVFTRKLINFSECDSRVSFFNISELNFHKSFLTIIATPANTHFEFITKSSKLSENILVEKPLFDYYIDPQKLKNIDQKQKIYIGYNLRFLDIIHYLKEIVHDFEKSNTPFSLNVLNTSHVKTWRKQTIKNSISLDPSKGGGALLEISHDIDLVDFLLEIDKEKINIKKIYQPLNIQNIDSSYNCIGISKKNVPFTIFSSLSSHIVRKQYILDSENISYEADLINNTLKKYVLGSINEVIKFNDSRDETFFKQIKNIFDDKEDDLLCSFENALNIQDILIKSTWL